MSKQPTPPQGLRRAADLLEQWSTRPTGQEEKMAEAFSEICAVHDALLANLRGKEVFAGVVRERDRQLGLMEQIKNLRKS